MSEGSVYSIDTSALLEGSDVRSYPFDLFPYIWVNVERLIEAGRLIASEHVLEELSRKDDAVAEWAKQHRGMFIAFDQEQERHTKRIMADFERLAANRPNVNMADPFVIALALHRNCAVVTMEKGGTDQKPKIPSVCRAYSVPCIDFKELIRRERLSLP